MGPRAKATPAPTEKGYAQVALLLPAFYIRVLDGEAAFLGQRRSQILELLVLRKLGLLVVERAPSAPKYTVKSGELDKQDRFVWHCRGDVKKQFDELRRRMGNIPPKTWITLALNEWIGLPSGMSELTPTR